METTAAAKDCRTLWFLARAARPSVCTEVPETLMELAEYDTELEISPRIWSMETKATELAEPARTQCYDQSQGKEGTQCRRKTNCMIKSGDGSMFETQD